MATIADILPIKWPNMGWSISGDDYETLMWYSPTPQPTEAEIRAFSNEVDLILAERVRLGLIQDMLIYGNSGGELYVLFKVLLEFAFQVATKPAIEWDTTELLAKVQQLRDLEAQHPPPSV